MKKLVPFCFFVFVAFLTLSSLGNAGQAGRVDLGIAVSKEIRDVAGHAFRITVIPPSNRAVDPAIFEGLEFSQETNKTRGFETLSSSSSRNDAPQQKPIDVTGYEIFIEPVVTGAQSSCTGSYIGIKTAPVSLAPLGQFQVSSTSPEFMNVVAYPIVGNVDTYVFAGTTLCSSAKNAAGRLDAAGCFSTTCHNTATLKSRVKNPSSTITAKFVSITDIFFVTL